MATVAPGVLRSVNPATLEEVGAVPVTEPAAVPLAVERAATAQARWAQVPLRRRGELLAAAAETLLGRMDDVAATVTAETGKPLVESYTAEVLVALESLAWLRRAAGRVLRPERVRYPQPYLWHKRAATVYEPLGVVAVVSPWNFPFGIAFTEVAFAVAAGNGVVLKPSELTPLSGEWVGRIWKEAGAGGLVQVVHGEGPTVGDALVRAPGVAKVFFTGSPSTGRLVAAAAAEALRPVSLELGGKDPFVVFADADLERAVAGAVWGSFSNCGQICSGAERVYVERPLLDRFAEALARDAGRLRLGRGEDPATDLGPIVSEAQRARVEELVADAVERGARVLCGGERADPGLPGWFYAPTVLADVPPDARIQREEVFGPVVTVAPFEGDDEAVRLANASSFGLGASLWTRDRARAARVAARLDAGSVWTNDIAYTYATGRASWGGTKESGYGRGHSRHGLYAHSRIKHVDHDRGLLGVPWWYPYSPQALDGFKGLLGASHARGPGRRAGVAWRHRRGLAHLLGRLVRR